MAMIPCTVNTMNPDLNRRIQLNSSSTGEVLFREITDPLFLGFTNYFGLNYIDEFGCEKWLQLKEKILDQRKLNNGELEFYLKFKCYPKDVTEINFQGLTMDLFYLQINDEILSSKIHCSLETSVLLASYSMQAKHGDYNVDLDISADRLMTNYVMQNVGINSDEYAERVIHLWKDHKGMNRETSRLEYLKIVQNLDTYGITYFDIKNRTGKALYLGVNGFGLSFYEKTDKSTPILGFKWKEINEIKFEDKKFKIYLNNKIPLDRSEMERKHFLQMLR